MGAMYTSYYLAGGTRLSKLHFRSTRRSQIWFAGNVVVRSCICCMLAGAVSCSRAPEAYVTSSHTRSATRPLGPVQLEVTDRVRTCTRTATHWSRREQAASLLQSACSCCWPCLLINLLFASVSVGFRLRLGGPRSHNCPAPLCPGHPACPSHLSLIPDLRSHHHHSTGHSTHRLSSVDHRPVRGTFRLHLLASTVFNTSTAHASPARHPSVCWSVVYRLVLYHLCLCVPLKH